jgi:hypothetical protein
MPYYSDPTAVQHLAALVLLACANNVQAMCDYFTTNVAIDLDIARTMGAALLTQMFAFQEPAILVFDAVLTLKTVKTIVEKFKVDIAEHCFQGCTDLKPMTTILHNMTNGTLDPKAIVIVKYLVSKGYNIKFTLVRVLSRRLAYWGPLRYSLVNRLPHMVPTAIFFLKQGAPMKDSHNYDYNAFREYLEMDSVHPPDPAVVAEFIVQFNKQASNWSKNSYSGTSVWEYFNLACTAKWANTKDIIRVFMDAGLSLDTKFPHWRIRDSKFSGMKIEQSAVSFAMFTCNTDALKMFWEMDPTACMRAFAYARSDLAAAIMRIDDNTPWRKQCRSQLEDTKTLVDFFRASF